MSAWAGFTGHVGRAGNFAAQSGGAGQTGPAVLAPNAWPQVPSLLYQSAVTSKPVQMVEKVVPPTCLRALKTAQREAVELKTELKHQCVPLGAETWTLWRIFPRKLKHCSAAGKFSGQAVHNVSWKLFRNSPVDLLSRRLFLYDNSGLQ